MPKIVENREFSKNLETEILRKEVGFRMKQWKWHSLFMLLLIALAGLGLIGGCDSGKKAVDEFTGNRAVKQYHKSKKDIGKIAEQQTDRYNSINSADDQESDQ